MSCKAVTILASLLLSVHALPAPQIESFGENTGPVAGVTPTLLSSSTQTTSPDGVGPLRGDSRLLGGIAPEPNPNDHSAVVNDVQLVGGQTADGDLGLYLDLNSADPPQPIRGDGGQTDPGPRTYAYEKLNPDVYAPPATDAGTLPQGMWNFGMSHNRFGTGSRSGWARQQNQDVLPIASEMAGVDMRLAPNAYRELHWHTANEWGLVLKGCVRLAAVNEDGKNFLDDVCEGDVWFFPTGVPHSIQALEEGAEFLLVFDSGEFNEDATFLASELFLRNPIEVLSKNLKADTSAFDNLPKDQLYIFNGTPAPTSLSSQEIISPAGHIQGSPDSYTYHWSLQPPHITSGGSIKILDPTTFPIASRFSVALVTIAPGAMREIHWHATSDEWAYFLQGAGRVTVFQAPASSRTFDFTSNGVGYIPQASSHYIENVGTGDLIYLEVLQAERFTDISVNQWLALTPRQVVKDTLGLPDSVLDGLSKEKEYVIAGNTNLTALAGGGKAFVA